MYSLHKYLYVTKCDFTIYTNAHSKIVVWAFFYINKSKTQFVSSKFVIMAHQKES